MRIQDDGINGRRNVHGKWENERDRLDAVGGGKLAMWPLYPERSRPVRSTAMTELTRRLRLGQVTARAT